MTNRVKIPLIMRPLVGLALSVVFLFVALAVCFVAVLLVVMAALAPIGALFMPHVDVTYKG